MEKFDEFLVEVRAGVSPVDAVVAVGIHLHFKLLVGRHEGIDIAQGVGVMHIVVGRTGNNQEVP